MTSTGTGEESSSIEFDFLEKSNSMLLKMLSKHTKQSVSKIKTDCLRDFYMTAEEAVDYGMVDYIL